MSGGKFEEFPVSSEIELKLEKFEEWCWYRVMHKFPGTGGGGWVRALADDGTLDNSETGIRIVSGSNVARASRKVPVKKKR